MKNIFLILLMFTGNISFSHTNHALLEELKMVHYDENQVTKVQVRKSKTLEKYILVLIFSNKCPHCIQFSPVLKHYSQVNHLKVEAISLNGQGLPEFPNPIFATQEMLDVAYQGKTVVYPALFLANTQNRKLYPVSFGGMSYLELQDRMQRLKRKIAQFERNNHA